MEYDPDILAEYVTESLEHLGDVESRLLAIEEAGESMDMESVNTVFRAIHSVKGAAGFLGLGKINDLAHVLEDVLNRLRNRELTPTSLMINSCLQAADQLKSILADIEHESSAEIAENVAALNLVLNGGGGAAVAVAVKPITAVQVEASYVAVSAEVLRDFLLESHEMLDQSDRDLCLFDREPDSEALLRGIFRSFHTIKGTAGFLGYSQTEQLTHDCENLLNRVRNHELSWSPEIYAVIMRTVDALRDDLGKIESGARDGGSHQELRQSLAQFARPESKRGAAPRQPATAVAGSPVKQAPAKVNAARTPAKPTETQEAAKPSAAATGPVADSTIRVDVTTIDKLMNHMGELVLVRNRILQLTSGSVDSSLNKAAHTLNMVTAELQDGIMKTRMQPIGNVWSKFTRVVRDLAQQCRKQVRIEMTGKETELDKSIIEAVKDPLTHLVRNSVDHGIEMPEDRIQAGKSAEGVLYLRAFHEGGQVVIEVADDGRGLNLERIRQKAVQQGLVNENAAKQLSDGEIAQLIFAPGFSTAEKVTHVSGRGVGMDVVKTNIERIGGMIDIDSREGAGTVIKIKIPLTLAIIPALTVTDGGQRFAIPQASLMELVRVENSRLSGMVEYVHDVPVHRLRGKLLPLVRLREVLGIPGKTPERSSLFIVVLKVDGRQFGLVVDSVSDTAEIVVKPLSPRLKHISVFAGATIMGDGQVALILDLPGIARHANLAAGGGEAAQGDSKESSSAAEAPSVATMLIVPLAGDQRVALPIQAIARLEMFSVDRLERADGTRVVQYRGGILPLYHIAELLGGSVASTPQTEALSVIVFEHGGCEFGVVVDDVEMVKSRVDLRRSAARQGYLGSAVIDKRVCDMLDISALQQRIDGLRAVQA